MAQIVKEDPKDILLRDLLSALRELSATAKESLKFVPTEPQDNPSRNTWHDLDIAIKAADRVIAKTEAQ